MTAVQIYSTFRAVWIRGAGVKPLRGGVAPTPPVPNSCENRCSLWSPSLGQGSGVSPPEPQNHR